jgi:hypothetical protein
VWLDPLILIHLLLYLVTGEGAVKGEAKTQVDALEAELQYDYLTAYLDFFTPSGPTVAGPIAAKYLNHPVVKKRKLFEEIDRQLKEAAGVAIEEKSALDDSRERKLANLASTDPAIDFTIEANKIEVTYANLSKCTINYFVMDIELLFSTKPFIKVHTSRHHLSNRGCFTHCGD